MSIDIAKAVLPLLLKGTVYTIELTLYSIILGSILGVFITLMRISNNKILASIASIYNWIFRGTPLLLQISFFYFGLYFVGITMTTMEAAILSLSLNSAAYMSEIIRGGILSVDKGQFEASKALGFGYFTTMRKIILPQTIRVIIPSVSNQFIGLLKDTSLVSVIALEELMKTASLQVSARADFTPYIMAAVIYLILTSMFNGIFSLAEKKLSVY
ncbi:amino acid ABC transporter permease [Clostridium sp. 19966]|uniref:amino acid ABC transporter permease n=1 Tax=Clostridium sp. 19966 TaxID=2768166 RepID=UPI0028DE9947|nr:amino acid ABC transporter permease [Clostridium sp. 19966]MDT8717322.1 amino acid ABC transporter permease [Clostridium sp. 19966]